MSILLGKKIKLFSLSSNRDLAEEIASSIGLELSHCEVKHFADGEINVDISETVRGHHIFVIQPVSSPVNDNLMELLIMSPVETAPKSLRHSCGSELTRQGISLP